MAFEWQTCSRCHAELKDDDQVVVAAKQLNVTGINAPPHSEHADGAKRVWHEAHWPGDTSLYKERMRGRWADLRPEPPAAVW